MSEVKAVVTKYGLFNVQVCVPKDFTDEQVISFAEGSYPCGTQDGWSIRKQGSKLLQGDDERVECANDNKKVHIMLDC
jgi:hypothetical protein